MRKFLPVAIIIFLSLFSFQSIKAQKFGPAIINDPDGFCNIRENFTKQSKIQDTLSNGRLVYMLPEEPVSNWLSIDYNKGEQYRSGCVHRSRVVFLKDMTAFKANRINDSLLTLSLTDMLITIKTGAFSKAGRKMIYEKTEGGYELIKTIDGKNPLGTEALSPEIEYKSIQLRSGSHNLAFPKTWFNDLFSPLLGDISACFDKASNTVYIIADHGDASTSCICIWVIKNGTIEHREVFTPF